MAENAPEKIDQPKPEEETSVGLPFKVILFNDDWHTFDEVIMQLIKAIKCTFEEAKLYTLEAHFNGKAVVFTGELTKCLKASSILEEIALKTQIISE